MKIIFSKIRKEDKRVIIIVILILLLYEIVKLLVGFLFGIILFIYINLGGSNYDFPKDFDTENSIKGNFLEFIATKN